ncbi:hypothetical protein D7322_15110 [Sphingobacterium puteale]|uniref:Uncharacterized protein n=1 Tax=Sphingobacterium puteale TaxID=2420510 RepID=A0A420VWH9_9SPHI|nr:hypothetical protein D7322_15110 [Sphingobacterium puteale]
MIFLIRKIQVESLLFHRTIGLFIHQLINKDAESRQQKKFMGDRAKKRVPKSMRFSIMATSVVHHPIVHFTPAFRSYIPKKNMPVENPYIAYFFFYSKNANIN